jgi:hypothetical protein
MNIVQLVTHFAIKVGHNAKSPENGELMASLIVCCAETHNTCCSSPLACTTKKNILKIIRKYEYLE